MKELIVISLAGDARENRKSKEAIRGALRCTGGAMIENAIISVRGITNVVNEVFFSSEEGADFRKHIKERIATTIGQQALEDKFIKFSEKQGRFETAVKGELFIFNSTEVEDDGSENRDYM